MKNRKKLMLAAGILSLCVGVSPVYAGTWKEAEQNWNYWDDEGNQIKNQWIFDKEDWYFLDTEGNMFTGWKRMGGQYYYFDESTGALAKGWKEYIDGQKFYYNAEGKLQTGWLKDQEKWYWFDETGKLAVSTWKTIDGEKYYFNADGTMAMNQYVGLYYMDENGKKDETKKLNLEVKGRITSSEESEIAKDLESIPQIWVNDFVKRGFKIVLEKDKTYLSKKTLDDGSIYYRHHSLDVGSRRIRATDADGVFRGMCEYIGYYSGALKEGSAFLYDYGYYLEELKELFDFSDEFDGEERMYFGECLYWYLNTTNSKREMEKNAPNLCEALEVALDPSKELKIEDRPDGPYKRSLTGDIPKSNGPASQ